MNQKKNELDYETAVQDRKKVFHINMLKKYEERKEIEEKDMEKHRVCTVIAEDTDHGQVQTYNDKKTMGVESVMWNPDLQATQVEELKGVIHKFEEVFSYLPGWTEVV